jgi:tRNA dimethylallyltransferase
MSALLPKAIFLMGPTASGKTDLAVRLVEALPLEIISVDSALVYRDMDIGTAKPDAETLHRAPHHLINLLDPSERYSAGRFRKEALQAMGEIHARGKVPLLVGGTMLYFKALLGGLEELPATDEVVRERLARAYQQQGRDVLHARLREVDPLSAERIRPSDPQRILRALEVFESSGTPLSAWQAGAGTRIPWDIQSWALVPEDRAQLRERIALRFEQMLAAGLLDEVRRLHARGDLDPSLPSIRCVGYRQAWDFLEGHLDETEWVEKAITATRQLAKRQLTWLRNWSDPALRRIDPFACSPEGISASRPEEIFNKVLEDLGKFLHTSASTGG